VFGVGVQESDVDKVATELKDFVKSHLAVYKYPRWIEFVSSLPKNDRGKIDRKKLKKRSRGLDITV
jgi:acyl-coenzyme A synthetase/AMP-(fatty) acid ligase